MAKKKNGKQGKKDKRKGKSSSDAGKSRDRDMFDDGSSGLDFENPVADNSSRHDSNAVSPTSDSASTFEQQEARALPRGQSHLGAIKAVALSVSTTSFGRDSGMFDSDDDDADMMSPTSPTEEAEEAGPEIEIDDIIEKNESHEHSRRGKLYLIFMLITLGLFPAYFLFFLLTVWLMYLVPNSLSVVGVVVSAVVPVVLYIGFRSARKSKLSHLRFYSFLMLLAINLQVSVCLVVIFDKAVSKAYLASFVFASQELCADMDSGSGAPFGSSLLPVEELCACTDVGSADGSWQSQTLDDVFATESVVVNGTAGNQTAGEAGYGVGGVMVECLQGVLKDQGVGRDELVIVSLVTLLVEFLLAWLGYRLIEDIELKAEKKAGKKKGGRQIGTIRGSIISGEKLLSGHTKKPSKRKNNFSSRYAVLSMNNPTLHDKSHRLQKAQTDAVEDDPNPTWNHEFDDFAVYSGTKCLTLKVFDIIEVSQSRQAAAVRKAKKSAHDKSVLVGIAGDSHGDGIHFEGDTLVDHDHYVMNGEEEADLSIDLYRVEALGKKASKNKKKGEQVKEYAGTVKLNLIFAPTRSLLSNAAAKITETWYFESTVLMMVFFTMVPRGTATILLHPRLAFMLNRPIDSERTARDSTATAQVSLALDSPANPPSPTLYGALRILELFIATVSPSGIGFDAFHQCTATDTRSMAFAGADNRAGARCGGGTRKGAFQILEGNMVYHGILRARL